MNADKVQGGARILLVVLKGLPPEGFVDAKGRGIEDFAAQEAADNSEMSNKRRKTVHMEPLEVVLEVCSISISC